MFFIDVNECKWEFKNVVENDFVCDKYKRIFDKAHLGYDWEVW